MPIIKACFIFLIAFVNEIMMVLKYIDLGYHLMETYWPFSCQIDLESVLPINVLPRLCCGHAIL